MVWHLAHRFLMHLSNCQNFVKFVFSKRGARCSGEKVHTAKGSGIVRV